MISADVLIIGAGPAGAAAALSLLTYSNFSVAIIESTDLDTSRVGENVDASLFLLLSYLKIEPDALEADTFLQGHSRSALWGGPVPVARHSIFDIDTTSYQLDREKFDLALLMQVAERGGLIYPRTRTVDFVRTGERWTVRARHRQRGALDFSARFLVDATGRQAYVCRQLKAPVTRTDKLVGVGRFYEFEDRQPQEIYMQTSATGWWYGATLPGARKVVTHFSDADLIHKEELNRDDRWNEYLQAQQHISHLCEGAVRTSGLWVRNAFSQIADTSRVPGLLAVGDAVASFDPLSSMGIGFAIATGTQGGRALHYALEGDGSFMRSYGEDVKRHFDDYLIRRRVYYGLERRWSAHKFWERRHT